jgi:hypothetical protein
VIVVLGRPVLSAATAATGGPGLGGRGARIARLVAGRGAPVELVGSVGDDPEGDLTIVELGRAGIGHAAVLRDPAARTPVEEGGRTRERGQAPRLDAADVELGLRYMLDCKVLVVAERLSRDASAAAAAAADYHGAALVVVLPGEGGGDAVGPTSPDGSWPPSATILQAPSDPEDGEEDASGNIAFETMVADFAVRLERGDDAAGAFRAALGDAAWEPAVDD